MGEGKLAQLSCGFGVWEFSSTTVLRIASMSILRMEKRFLKRHHILASTNGLT